MTRSRRTPQLEAVFAVVRDARDHPTAEQIHDRVRAALPHISLGTVYRNLDKLAESGAVQLVHLGERQARFDAVTEAHDHFLCEGCGAVVDLHAPRLVASQCGFAESGYSVRTVTSVVRGLCPGCSAGSDRRASDEMS